MIKKILLLLSMVLAGTAAMALGQYDSCRLAKNICEGAKVFNVSTGGNTDDNNLTTDCGGSFRRGAWFSFITQNSFAAGTSVNVTVTNNSVSAALDIVVLDGPCGGPYTTISSTCSVSTGTSSVVIVPAPLTPNHKYYILVGSSTNLPATFDINVNSSGGLAVISGTVPNLSASINSEYVCNLSDSLITFTNNSLEGSSNLIEDTIHYTLQVYSGSNKLVDRWTPMKPFNSPWYAGVQSETLNIYKLVQKDQGNDSVDVCLVAKDLCNASPNNKSCKSYYIQRSDARFDTLAHNQCGGDSVGLKLIMPYAPRAIRPSYLPARDSMVVDYVRVEVDMSAAPCGTIITKTFSSIPASQHYLFYNFKPCNPTNGLYPVKVRMFVKNACDSGYAYKTNGDFTPGPSKPQPLLSQDSVLQFNIFAPPVFDYDFTTDTVPGVGNPTLAWGPNDSVCSNKPKDTLYVRFRRRPLYGNGHITYTVTPQGNSSIATRHAAPADSIFMITNIPAHNGTNTTQLQYTVKAVDSKGCDTAGSFAILVRPKVTANIPPQPKYCVGASPILNTSTSSGLGPFKYLWFSVGTNGSVTALSGGFSSTPTFAAPGITKTTTYKVLIEDNFGCRNDTTSASSMVTVQVNANPTVSINPIPNVCITQGGNPTSIPLSTSGSYSSYFWSCSAGTLFSTGSCTGGTSTTSPCATPYGSTNTTTVYCVTVTDANSCSADTCITTSFANIPSNFVQHYDASANVTTSYTPAGPANFYNICKFDTGKTKEIIITLRHMVPSETSTWTVPAEFTPVGNSPKNGLVTHLITGTYTFNGTGICNNTTRSFLIFVQDTAIGCQYFPTDPQNPNFHDSLTVNFNIGTAPTLGIKRADTTATIFSVCKGRTINLAGFDTCNTGASLKWKWGDGSPDDNFTTNNTPMSHLYANAGSYVVTLTGMAGSCGGSTTASITVCPRPIDTPALTDFGTNTVVTTTIAAVYNNVCAFSTHTYTLAGTFVPTSKYEITLHGDPSGSVLPVSPIGVPTFAITWGDGINDLTPSTDTLYVTELSACSAAPNLSYCYGTPVKFPFHIFKTPQSHRLTPFTQGGVSYNTNLTCADTIYHYGATSYDSQSTYLWSITPATRGTILTPNPDSTINVKWIDTLSAGGQPVNYLSYKLRVKRTNPAGCYVYDSLVVTPYKEPTPVITPSVVAPICANNGNTFGFSVLPVGDGYDIARFFNWSVSPNIPSAFTISTVGTREHRTLKFSIINETAITVPTTIRIRVQAENDSTGGPQQLAKICPDSSNIVTFVLQPKPKVTITNKAVLVRDVCQSGGVVALTATLSSPYGTPTWTAFDTTTHMPATGTFSGYSVNSPSTNYTPGAAPGDTGIVRLTIKNANAPCAADSDTVYVHIYPKPVITVKPAFLAYLATHSNRIDTCAGTVLNFGAYVTASYYNHVNWTFNTTAPYSAGDSTIQNANTVGASYASTKGDTATLKQFILTATSDGNPAASCTATYAITVKFLQNIPPTVTILVSPDTICNDMSGATVQVLQLNETPAQLTNRRSTAFWSVVWVAPDGDSTHIDPVGEWGTASTINQGTIFQLVPYQGQYAYNPTKVRKYKVKVKVVNNLCNSVGYDSAYFYVRPFPFAAFDATKRPKTVSIICQNDPNGLPIDITYGSTDSVRLVVTKNDPAPHDTAGGHFLNQVTHTSGKTVYVVVPVGSSQTYIPGSRPDGRDTGSYTITVYPAHYSPCSNGVTSSDQSNFTVRATPRASIFVSQFPLCERVNPTDPRVSATFTTPGSRGAAYKWTAVNQNGLPTGTFTYTPAGTTLDTVAMYVPHDGEWGYTYITLTTSNGPCGTDAAIDSVYIISRPTSILTADDYICKGRSAVLTIDGQHTQHTPAHPNTTPATPVNVTWRQKDANGNYTIVVGNTSTISVTPTATTGYQVTWYADDFDPKYANYAGCPYTDTVTVHVIPGPILQLVDIPRCINDRQIDIPFDMPADVDSAIVTTNPVLPHSIFSPNLPGDLHKGLVVEPAGHGVKHEVISFTPDPADINLTSQGFQVRVTFGGGKVSCGAGLYAILIGQKSDGSRDSSIIVAEPATVSITQSDPMFHNAAKDTMYNGQLAKVILFHQNENIVLTTPIPVFNGLGGQGQWQTTGSGTFYPNDNKIPHVYRPNVIDDDNTHYYYPSEADNLSDGFTLSYVIQSYKAGGTDVCQEAKDALVIMVRNITISKIINVNSGNSKNKALYIDGEPQGSHLRVFDRWGRVVYDNNDYQSGTWSGDGLDAGVYFYELTYKLGHKNGTVQIIR